MIVRSKKSFKCSIEGCDRDRPGAKGYCSSHYSRLIRGIPLEMPMVKYKRLIPSCAVEGCNRKYYMKGYCEKHHSRLSRGKPVDIDPFRHTINGLNANGYIDTTIDGIRKYQHVRVAELALGKTLPKGAQVHHINGVKHDNRPENLIVCPTNAYHALIERRTKSYEACGHADWLRCRFCECYDNPSNFKIYKNISDSRHLYCSKKGTK